jgi:hypothetical protein
MKWYGVLTILPYSWDPSNYPPKDFKFKKIVYSIKNFKVHGSPLSAF